MRVAATIEIECPVAEVWRFVRDRTNDPAWCAKVKSVDRLGANGWRVRHKPIPLGPVVLLTVEEVAAEEPHRLVLREEDDASVFDVEYRLAPTSLGTRFTQVSEFRWKRLPMLLQRLLARGVGRDVRRQLRDLKRTLETS